MPLLLTKVRRNGTVDMLIVLGDDSLERIKQHDPFEQPWAHLPPDYSTRRPGTIGVTYASDAEQRQITNMSLHDPDWKDKAFAQLTRGFQFQPERGDHDFGPTVLGKSTPGAKQ